GGSPRPALFPYTTLFRSATIGAGLATVSLWFGVQTITTDWLGGTQAGLLGSVDFVSTQDVLTIAPLLVGLAIVLATISSVVTLRSEEHTSALQSRENLVC